MRVLTKGASNEEHYNGTFYELKKELVDAKGDKLMRFLFDEDELKEIDKNKQLSARAGSLANRGKSEAKRRKMYSIRHRPKGSFNKLITSFNRNPNAVKTFSKEDRRRTIKTTAGVAQSAPKSSQTSFARWGVNTKIKEFFRPKSTKKQFRAGRTRNCFSGFKSQMGASSSQKIKGENPEIRKSGKDKARLMSSSSQKEEGVNRSEKLDMRNFIGTSKMCVDGKADLVGQKLQGDRTGTKKGLHRKSKIDDYFLSNRTG